MKQRKEWETVGPAAQILINVTSHHVNRGRSPAELRPHEPLRAQRWKCLSRSCGERRYVIINLMIIRNESPCQRYGHHGSVPRDRAVAFQRESKWARQDQFLSCGNAGRLWPICCRAAG